MCFLHIYIYISSYVWYTSPGAGQAVKGGHHDEHHHRPDEQQDTETDVSTSLKESSQNLLDSVITLLPFS